MNNIKNVLFKLKTYIVNNGSYVMPLEIDDIKLLCDYIENSISINILDEKAKLFSEDEHIVEFIKSLKKEVKKRNETWY